MPTYGPVGKEQVYVLTRDRALPIPTPPPMRNHGNVIVSLSQVGRWLAERAESEGATFLPETAAVGLLVEQGRWSACAPATRAAGTTARSWATSSRAATSSPA